MTEFMKIVRDSIQDGSNEEIMWNAVRVADEILGEIKESHPEKYDCYMRRMSEALFGPHYTEELARKDVEAMFHIDSAGTRVSGAHWSPDEIESVTRSKEFPTGTNIWDKYVIFNALHHDLTGKFSDGDIIDIVFSIFFADDDSDCKGKVWKYIQASH